MVRLIFGLIFAIGLAGCNDSSTNPSATAVSPPPPAAASALIISGAPRTSIVAGNSYSFVPTASGPTGSVMTFSIQNKPSWASFNASTGELSGTPTVANIGTTVGILISASDGSSSAALPAFKIDVTQIGTGSATLSWMPPMLNTDGSALTNLAGYRIYYGVDRAALTKSIEVNSTGIATYVVGNLSPATWYFSIKAYTTANIESDFSGIASTTIS